MNWKEADKQYPKVYEKYPLIFDIARYSTRNLYDFFDEQGITLTPRPIFYAGDYSPDYWSFEVGGVCIDHRFRVKTRKEAEEAAFIKAFEILESKIKE